MRLFIQDDEMSDDVIGALKRTSKGQLTYDSKWRDEGRAQVSRNEHRSVNNIQLLHRKLSTLSNKASLRSAWHPKVFKGRMKQANQTFLLTTKVPHL